MIPSKGKGVVQTGLAISLPSGVYARIAPCSRFVVKKFIDVGAGVIGSDYQGEIGVVLFDHLAVDFLVQVGDMITQDPSKPYVVVIDTSGLAAGGVLMQDQDQGLRPLAFMSRALKPNEQWYSAYERELAAIAY